MYGRTAPMPIASASLERKERFFTELAERWKSAFPHIETGRSAYDLDKELKNEVAGIHLTIWHGI